MFRHPLLVPGFCGSVQLEEFDQVGNVSPVWEERAAQIGRGRPELFASFATTSRLQLAFVRRGPGARIQGSTRPDIAAFGVAVSGPGMHVQRQPAGPEGFAFSPPNSEYEVLSPAPHRLLGAAVHQSLLDEAVRERWGATARPSFGGLFLRVKGEAERRAVIRTWARWLRRGVARPADLTDPVVAARMEEEVVGALLDAVDPAPDLRPARPRRELALRAEAYIRETLGEPVRLDDVCAAVGASPRSLHASFQSIFGLSPKAYQRALRFSAARRELLRPRPGMTVSGVAVRWGFMQFGYFAVDYRRMFGESPRDTLRRAKGGSAREARVATSR